MLYAACFRTRADRDSSDRGDALTTHVAGDPCGLGRGLNLLASMGCHMRLIAACGPSTLGMTAMAGVVGTPPSHPVKPFRVLRTGIEIRP